MSAKHFRELLNTEPGLGFSISVRPAGGAHCIRLQNHVRCLDKKRRSSQFSLSSEKHRKEPKHLLWLHMLKNLGWQRTGTYPESMRLLSQVKGHRTQEMDCDAYTDRLWQRQRRQLLWKEDGSSATKEAIIPWNRGTMNQPWLVVFNRTA